MNAFKGITNLGEWVSWNPDTQGMEIHSGGTWTMEDGRFGEYSPKAYSEEGFLDAQGLLVTPGLIDPHTHPAFGATRELEFELRSQGKSYQEIAAAGGGILNSVDKLRAISQKDLEANVEKYLASMLSHGTTTVECKSGYGLSIDSEIKSLRAIKTASEKLEIKTVSTLLGAHEIPREYKDDRDAYVRLLVEEMIPAVAAEDLAEYCDVFCETGVYTIEETREILTAARKHGMNLRFHADEFQYSGGAKLAAEIDAHSADHLMAITEDGIQALANSDTVATLLPGTTFFLGTNTWAPARQMLDAGVTLALASDFNPGSNMSLSMPFVMTLAVIYLKMTPLEALQATTYGAGKSLRLHGSRGAIHQGYEADLVIWDLHNHRQLPYFYGSNQAAKVLVNGREVLPQDL